jgi:hypothetical protein
MSTPVQYVPTEFQDVLNLPQGGTDPAALAAAKAALLASQNKVKGLQATLDSWTAKLKRAGRMTPEQLAQVKLKIKVATGALGAANKAMAEAQNRAYEVNGDWDRLLQGGDRDAFLALKSMFTQMGLGTLAPKIFDFVKQGYGADTIGLLLQDTSEYKERFKANDARAKAGLAVLSPAEYLSAESAYRQILDSAGMPKGFYDNPADFRSWIAGDVSPTEIKGRVDMATDAVSRVDPSYRGALFQMYGIGEHDLAAYFLDRKKAEPILKKQAAASAIGAAALRRGLGTSLLDMEGYASLGITGQEAEQAYGRIAEGFESMLGIAGRYGSSWTQREAEQELFTPGAAGSLGSENAAEKGKRLKSQERGLFGGGRGSSSQGLNAGYRQT